MKTEVAVLGSPALISLMVSVNVKQHRIGREREIQNNKQKKNLGKLTDYGQFFLG